MNEETKNNEGEALVTVQKNEWERLHKLEASYKLTKKYVSLLEGSNKQLDHKILEQALLNEIAKGFSSAAYDQWNIAGFIFSTLKKKLELSLYGLLLLRDEKRSFILASEQKLSEEVKTTLRLRMTDRFAKETNQAPDPASVMILEQIVPNENSNGQREIKDLPLIYTDSLAVYNESFGVMVLGLEKSQEITREDEHFFQILASQVALFVENDRVRQAITNEKNKLEALSKELQKEINAREFREQELQKKNEELEKALREIKVLQGFIPICAWCKKIRDVEGYWHQMEAYIQEHSQITFSHGMCRDCMNSQNINPQN